MQTAILRLFHAIVIDSASQPRRSAIFKETIPYGFVFAPTIINTFSDHALRQVIPDIAEELGLTKEQLNQTFHKSWKKVRNTDLDKLFLEQITHYFTTYGFEALGIYDEHTVYIPTEKLQIPDIKEKEIKLTLIQGLTQKQIEEKILKLLESGVALKDTTIADIMSIISDFEMVDRINVDSIKNKEVKCILCDRLGKIPAVPTEFLRFVLYKLIHSTLLIKNTTVIEQIKNSIQYDSDMINIFTQYNLLYGLEQLASIFYRFKPIFLALRANPDFKPAVNKIRKLAIEHHKPMPEDYLNMLTGHLKNGELEIDRLQTELAKVNLFRKVRLAYALNYRLTNNDAILYKVRNGKAYATAIDPKTLDIPKIQQGYNIVIQSIITDLAKKIQGKKIYFDPQITYALPSTEKQFSGNIPCGSFLTLPKNMILGVHWTNLPEQDQINDWYGDRNGRVDLDLSLLGLTKFGWDGSYRSDRSGDILFSGDITDAPQGATEAFFIKKQTPSTYLLMLNHYNRQKETKVSFKIFASRENGITFDHHYMVDLNKVEMLIPNVMDAQEKMLGLVLTTDKNTIFYIGETNMGKDRSAKDTEYMRQTRSYMTASFTHPITLNNILIQAGAIVVKKKEDADLDLSVEALQKDTILKLFM